MKIDYEQRKNQQTYCKTNEKYNLSHYINKFRNVN